MKKIKAIILGLVLVLALNTVAFADIKIDTDGVLKENELDDMASSMLRFKTLINDGADILNSEEELKLLEKADKIANKYDINIIMYTDNEYIFDSQSTAENIYLSHFEEYSDGIIFYVNMSTRDYYFATSGDVRKSISDSYGLAVIEDEVTYYLSDGDYYDSFDEFLRLVKKFEKEAEFGLPYCFINPYRTFFGIVVRVIIAVVIAMIIAFIRTGTQKAKLKTVKPESMAKNYIPKDGFNLTVNKDTFLFRNITKTAIPKSSSSGGGGGGRSRSGGGGSFGGRGGKF